MVRLCQEKPCNCARVGRPANSLGFVSLRLGVYEARDQECNSYGWGTGSSTGPDRVLDVEAARNALGFGERAASTLTPECLHVRDGFGKRATSMLAPTFLHVRDGRGERSTSSLAPKCPCVREGFAERTRRFHANARRVGAWMMQSAYRWCFKKSADQALSAYREISSQVMLA